VAIVRLANNINLSAIQVAGSDSIVPVTSMPLVSRGLPAYSLTGTAANAVDSTYATKWSYTGCPDHIYIDISSIYSSLNAASDGTKWLALTWYCQNQNYDPSLHGDSHSDFPGDYTAVVNAGAGGGSAPGSGWTTKATVTSNSLHSRTHLIEVTGMNWVGIEITQQADGSTSGGNLNVDFWDCALVISADRTKLNCGWGMVGDSITVRSMLQDIVGLGGPSYTPFNDLVYAIKGVRPLQECMAIEGYKASDIAAHIIDWFSKTPQKNHGLTIGTNDAIAATDSTTFGNAIDTIFAAAVSAGKMLHVTTIPYSANSTIETEVARLNGVLATKLAASSFVAGPDFHTLFQNGTITLDPDKIHPDNPGCEVMRSTWATYAANYGNGG